jgi:hypothetical protein
MREICLVRLDTTRPALILTREATRGPRQLAREPARSMSA